MMTYSLGQTLIPSFLNEKNFHEEPLSALLHLNDMYSEVIDYLQQKISSKQADLDNMQSIIDSCSEKIAKLKGRRDVTKMFNTINYPGFENYSAVKNLFDSKDLLEQSTANWKSLMDDHERSSNVADNPCKANIQFIPNIPRIRTKAPVDICRNDGSILDPVHWINQIRSVSSLLLYGTPMHVYKFYQPNMDGINGLKVEDAYVAYLSSEVHMPSDAPFSIQSGQELALPQREELHYAPVLGDVPSLNDLPDALPGLSNVAEDRAVFDNIHYECAVGYNGADALAPSLAILLNLEDLPDIEVINEDEDDYEKRMEDIPQPPPIPSTAKETAPVDSLGFIPPPPPVPVPTVPKEAEHNVIKTQDMSDGGPTVQQKVDTNATNTDKNHPVMGFDLSYQIINFDRRKLNTFRPEVRKAKQFPSEFRKHLQQRHDAISNRNRDEYEVGSDSSDSGEAGNVFDQIAKNMPYRPVKKSNASSDSDFDWS